MTLKQYIGRIPERGAFSRIAEASGLSNNTVHRCYRGESVSPSAQKKIQNAIHKRTKLFAKRRSDVGAKRPNYRRIAKADKQN